jgi:hypothetical protein
MFVAIEYSSLSLLQLMTNTLHALPVLQVAVHVSLKICMRLRAARQALLGSRALPAARLAGKRARPCRKAVLPPPPRIWTCRASATATADPTSCSRWSASCPARWWVRLRPRHTEGVVQAVNGTKAAMASECRLTRPHRAPLRHHQRREPIAPVAAAALCAANTTTCGGWACPRADGEATFEELTRQPSPFLALAAFYLVGPTRGAPAGSSCCACTERAGGLVACYWGQMNPWHLEILGSRATHWLRTLAPAPPAPGCAPLRLELAAAAAAATPGRHARRRRRRCSCSGWRRSGSRGSRRGPGRVAIGVSFTHRVSG